MAEKENAGAYRNATIVDVAQKCGVSVATVSRVVNKNYPVSEKTRLRVQAAIDELHYVPNVQARELNLRHSTTIGVVVPGLYNMFFAEVIDGIEAAVSNDKYSLLLSCARNDPAQEQASARELVARNVAGLIVISPNTETLEEDFYKQMAVRTPLIFINGYREIEGASYVMGAEAAGTRTALQYLLELGHRRIMFVRGSHSDSYAVKEEVYRELMQAEGLLDEQMIVDMGDGNTSDTVDDTEWILSLRLPELKPTAVFCCNDLMAVGVQHACQKAGLIVPEDISIVGYDNIALAHFVSPKLTTIDQQMFRLGHAAAELVIEKIRGGRNRRVEIENVLVERETTGQAQGNADM